MKRRSIRIVKSIYKSMWGKIYHKKHIDIKGQLEYAPFHDPDEIWMDMFIDFRSAIFLDNGLEP